MSWFSLYSRQLAACLLTTLWRYSMQAFSIEHLVLDAAPLLSTAASSSASSLRGLAQNFLTTPDVVSEIRDKTSRELFTATLQVLGLDTQDGKAEFGGLQIREPTAEAILKGRTPPICYMLDDVQADCT